MCRNLCELDFDAGCNLWLGGFDSDDNFVKSMCFAIGKVHSEGGLFSTPETSGHSFNDVTLSDGTEASVYSSSKVYFRWNTVAHPYNFSDAFLNSLTGDVFAELLIAYFKNGNTNVTDIIQRHGISYANVSKWKLLEGNDTGRETTFQHTLSVQYPEKVNGKYFKKRDTLYRFSWR